MAGMNAKAKADGADAPTEEDVVEAPEKLTAEVLTEHAERLLGYPPHFVAGALLGQPDLTVDEAKALVEKSLKTPLPQEG